jgi:hypothetical protein
VQEREGDRRTFLRSGFRFGRFVAGCHQRTARDGEAAGRSSEGFVTAGALAMSINSIRRYNLFARIVGGALAGLFGTILAMQDRLDDHTLIGGIVLGIFCGMVTSKKA